MGVVRFAYRRWCKLLLASAGMTRLLLSFGAVLALAAPAYADVHGPPASPAALDVANAKVVGGRILSGPGVPAPRDMGREHADAFLRSWFGYGLFGQPEVQEPPEGIDPYRVEIVFEDRAGNTQTMLVDYATDGDSAWVSIPVQDFGWGRGTGAWVKAPKEAKEAFDGTADALDVTPETGEPSSRFWFFVGIGLAALAVGLVVGIRYPRRGRGSHQSSPSRTRAREGAR